MKKNLNNRKIGIILILIVFKIITIQFAQMNPAWIEKYYSRGLYLVISAILTSLANIFPFSLGETVLLLLGMFILCLLIRMIVLGFRKKFSKSFQVLLSLLLLLAFLMNYVDYVWLLNNYRMNIENNMGLKSQEIDEITLAGTFRLLIERTNDAKELQVLEEEKTVSEVLHEASLGYQSLHTQYSFIPPQKVIVKGLMSSAYQSKSGYTGVYLFFVGEPNINIQPPIVSLPHTACHEIAHQKGFAYEDEANYIGFLACKVHPSPLFRYSGYLEASIYVGNVLYEQNPQLYAECAEAYSEAVRADFKEISEFWKKNENKKVAKVANQVNDTYLKTYNQPEGLKSYGLFVDLLIADFLQDGDL